MAVPILHQELPADSTLSHLSCLFPYIDSQWSLANVTMKTFSEGITNKLMGCFHENGTATEKAAIIRVFGSGTEKFLDREKELKLQVFLGKKGFSPKVFVRFTNGVCYGYKEGKPVSVISVRDQHISSLIAEKMAVLNSLNVEEYLEDMGMSKDKLEPFIWHKIDDFVNIIENECAAKLSANPMFPKIFGSVEDVRRHVAELREHIQSFSKAADFSLDLGLCHNDLLLNNILYDENTDEINFIDFEYGDINYAAFDIADHFVEYCGVDDCDFNRYPPKEYQLEWIRKYLAKRHALLNLDKVSEREIKLWYMAVQKFALVSYIVWGLWGLAQDTFSALDFDFFEFGVQRYSQFLMNKDNFCQLSIDNI